MLRKLLTFLLVFMLMHSLTACGGGSDWKNTLKEYEVFIDEYVELLQDYSKNPTDPDIEKKAEEMANKADEWSEKTEKVREQIKGTADEAEFNQQILDISGKLIKAIGGAGIMDQVMDGVEQEYGSEMVDNVLDYYGEDIG